MKRFFKRSIGVVLSLTMLINMNLTVNAYDNTAQNQDLIGKNESEELELREEEMQNQEIEEQEDESKDEAIEENEILGNEQTENEKSEEYPNENGSIIDEEILQQETQQTEEDVFFKLKEISVEKGWYSICSAVDQGLCLDVDGFSNSDGANIQLYTLKQNFAQRFLIIPKENGWYNIQNVSSEKMLGYESEQSKKVSQYTAKNEKNQEFKFYEDEQGRIIIRANCEDGKVLDIYAASIKKGTKLQLYRYNASNAQKFVLKKWNMLGENVNVEDGVYRIFPAKAPSVSLDLYGGSSENKANIQLYTRNDSEAQEWKIRKSGSWYKIVNVKSGKVLDVAGGSENPRANLQQYTDSNNVNQEFRFYKSTDNQFYIVSKLGTVIDCFDGKYTNRNNVWMYNWNGSDAQRWGLEKIIVPSGSEKKLDEGYYSIGYSPNYNLKISIEGKSVEKGANIQLAQESGTDEQVFKLEKQSDGWYMLKNQNSGKYFDVSSGSSLPGANLKQFTSNKSNAQKFKFYDAGQGKYYIKSKLLTYVESQGENEGNVYMNSVSGEDKQKWILTKVMPESSEVSIAEGKYNFKTALGNSQVLDIKSGSKNSGANVQIYTANASGAQSFQVKKETDGWYRIQNVKSKLYLEVKDGSSEIRANLQQGNNEKNIDAQKFKFYDAGSGMVFIKSKLGTIVDVQSGKNTPGTNVQMFKFNGANAQKWKIEKAIDHKTPHWEYKGGYKLYYNKNGELVKDVSNIIGKQSSYWIKVNKKQNVVTVYAKDGNNGYIIPVKAFVCSGGTGTPIGTFSTSAKYRWKVLMGPSWGQWSTRITGSILFHSVYYNSPNNNNNLSVSAYNKLGTTASHGCIRLTAGDAKWIYDNCKIGTKVTIYNSNDPGPFGKPKAYKLSYKHTWDPTDPNMAYKCKKKGCH